VRPIEAPAAFARDLRALPGVVDAGLFVGVADVVLVADGADVQAMRRAERVA
jgi:ribose 5-phosphate isomerase